MSTDPTKKKDDHVSTSKALDDEQRVKVLSPGMLVAKRFFRNKLAVAGPAPFSPISACTVPGRKCPCYQQGHFHYPALLP